VWLKDGSKSSNHLTLTNTSLRKEVSSGTITVVLIHINAFHTDILVTYCTSSSFCLLLSQSAAVITEEGGALSHAAITARELHIPAVVSAKNAAQVLQDGMLVRVDGTAGVVEIL
jgi:phosphohistidine swiveling domain-containing protein